MTMITQSSILIKINFLFIFASGDSDLLKRSYRFAAAAAAVAFASVLFHSIFSYPMLFAVPVVRSQPQCQPGL